MPMITIHFSTKDGRRLAETVARAANKLSGDILHKNPQITAVAVQHIAPGDWLIGDKSLAEQGLAAFWLDIRIVDGTNTRGEKAEFIAATFAKMSELLGPLHSESYVHVNEVRGDAYGYGGLTQNERYFAGKKASAAVAA